MSVTSALVCLQVPERYKLTEAPFFSTQFKMDCFVDECSLSCALVLRRYKGDDTVDISAELCFHLIYTCFLKYFCCVAVYFLFFLAFIFTPLPFHVSCRIRISHFAFESRETQTLDAIE